MTAGPLLPATGGAAGLVRAPLVPAVAPAGGKGPRERGEGGERKSANGAEGTGTNGVTKKGGKKEEKGEGENEKTDTVTLSDVNDVNLTVRTVPLSSA